MAQEIQTNTHQSVEQIAFPETNGSPLPNGLDPAPSQDFVDQEFFKEIRGGLMVIASLAAGSAYQAGLNPPGGYWQDDIPHRNILAGTPILHDKSFTRYYAFFWCNVISLLSSLAIFFMLLFNNTFYLNRRTIKVLVITVVVDLFSFMVAYAAGCCHYSATSPILLSLLMVLVSLYVIWFVRGDYLRKSILDVLYRVYTRPNRRNTAPDLHSGQL